LEVAVERFSPKAKGWELVSVIDIDGDAAEVCDVLDGASVALSLVKLSAIPSGIRYEMWADPTLRAEQLSSLVEGFFNGLTRAEEEGKVGHWSATSDRNETTSVSNGAAIACAPPPEKLL
jgi:hypothetical protein